MKKILIIFLYSTFSFAQNVDLIGHIKSSEDNSDFDGVYIYMIQNDVVKFEAISDEKGNYQIKNIPSGIYNIKMSFLGFKDKIISDFLINSETKATEFFFPDKCTKLNKICPYGHSDNIIPIVYGLPNKKMSKQAKKGKIVLGGCFQSCEKWYCNKHNIEF